MTGAQPRDPGRRAGLLLALLLALVSAVLYAGFARAPAVESVEAQTLDWRFRLRGPAAPGPETALVLIDDRTIAARGRWPLSRRDLATAVRLLSGDGARVVAFDLLLAEPETAPAEAAPPGPDESLAAAMAEAGDVVLPFAFAVAPGRADAGEVPDWITRAAYRVVRLPDGRRPALALEPEGLILPLPGLGARAKPAHVTVLRDADGVLRHDLPALLLGEAAYPSLPVEAARLYFGLAPDQVALTFGESLRLGDRVLPLDGLSRLPVDFYGPRGSFETHSFQDLVEGRLPPGLFRDRIVLIGAAAVGAGDSFATPLAGALPGAEYFATVTDNLLRGRALERSDRTDALDFLAVLLCGLLTAALFRLRALWLAALGSAVLAAGWFALAQYAFATAGLWLNLVFPLAAIALNGAVFGGLRVFGEGRRRARAERERDNLARFVPAKMARALAESDRPFELDRPQAAAVLFVDLAGFTTLSETMAPAEATALLRDFHRRVEEAAHAHRGTIDKFLGDGAMVHFGLLEPRLEDARDALACARALAEVVEVWNAELEAAGRPPLGIGVGVHYGPVTAGAVGGESQLQFTVTGDTVNVASRLEALTREQGVTILASDAAVAAARAAPGGIEVLAGFTELPARQLRGRARPLGLWAWPGEQAAAASGAGASI